MSTLPIVNITNRHSDVVAIPTPNRLPATVLTYTAAASITPKRIVHFGTAAGHVQMSLVATAAHIGVSASEVLAPTGSEVPIAVDGVVEVEAGAAITQGAVLTSDTAGRAVTAVATNAAWGVALESAAVVGNIIKARIGPRVILA